MTNDVSRHNPDVTSRQFEGVVPVPADVTAFGGYIPAGELDLRMGKRPRGQEPALEHAGCTALGGGYAGLSRRREFVGGEFQEHDVVAIKRLTRIGAHMNYSDQRATRDQGYSKHRANALFPQDRVRDRGRVHFVEDYGATLSGDSASESCPDRNTHTLAHLLFESTRRSRYELVGRSIVQKDCGGVATEKIENPVEQQGQQFVKVQGGQRHLADESDLADLTIPLRTFEQYGLFRLGARGGWLRLPGRGRVRHALH
jgi:hypothetical protein